MINWQPLAQEHTKNHDILMLNSQRGAIFMLVQFSHDFFFVNCEIFLFVATNNILVCDEGSCLAAHHAVIQCVRKNALATETWYAFELTCYIFDSCCISYMYFTSKKLNQISTERYMRFDGSCAHIFCSLIRKGLASTLGWKTCSYVQIWF